jgi:ELWxxDGT repeat protein
MYFLGRDGAATATTGDELWQTDGTPAGTQLVMDIHPGTEGSDPHNFFLTEKGSILFVANDGAVGAELWIMEPSGVNTSIFPPQRVRSHLITSVFPNPFRESIQLNLQLQRPELVQLSIFDASGKLVYQSGEKQMLPGEQQLLWQPAALPTGMYFCQLRVGDQVDSRMIQHQE